MPVNPAALQGIMQALLQGAGPTQASAPMPQQGFDGRAPISPAPNPGQLGHGPITDTDVMYLNDVNQDFNPDSPNPDPTGDPRMPAPEQNVRSSAGPGGPSDEQELKGVSNKMIRTGDPDQIAEQMQQALKEGDKQWLRELVKELDETDEGLDFLPKQMQRELEDAGVYPSNDKAEE